MKKLTAGIFAGILTIVTVNAADAAIATKAYVDQERDVVKVLTETNKTDITNLTQTVAGNTTNISNLTKTVEGHTTSISGLQTKVDGLTSGDGSVANQIANALGDIPEGSTVQQELEKKANETEVTAALNLKANAADVTADLASKADKTALEAVDAKVATNTSAIETLNGDGEGSVNKKIETAIAGVNSAAEALEGRVSTNETAIEKLDGADTVEGSVKKQIKDAIAGVDTKLADKQDLLNGTNVSTTGEGNVVSSVSAVDGVVTATKGINAVTVPTSNTPSESGMYVLTATVENGIPTYYWENIQRATPKQQ